MTRFHAEPHPQAGQTVTVTGGRFTGWQFTIEDWWDRVAGKSWMDCDGNPVCLEYAVQSTGKPIDDEVVYGKVGEAIQAGKLIHVSDLPAMESARQ